MPLDILWGLEVRVAWSVIGYRLKQHRQSLVADESQVVVTKHRHFCLAISTVRRCDNQQADEAAVFAILTFTTFRLILCRLSDDACVERIIPCHRQYHRVQHYPQFPVH